MYSLQYSHGISHLQSPSMPSNLSLNPDVEPYCLLLRLSIVTLLLAVWCYRGFWLVCPQTTGLNIYINIYIYYNDRPKNKLSDLHLKFSVWVWSVSFYLGSAQVSEVQLLKSLAGGRLILTGSNPVLAQKLLIRIPNEPQINQSDWIGLLKLYSAESYNQFTSSITSV